MTTKDSPLRVLKAQADKIAACITAFERGGPPPDVRFAERLEKARGRESIRIGIAMDDKILSLDLKWDMISAMGEGALAEYVLKLMREKRDDA